VSAAERQAKYESMEMCTSDEPQTVVETPSKMQCAVAATGNRRYRDYNFDGATKECSLYRHKPLLYTIGVNGYRVP